MLKPLIAIPIGDPAGIGPEIVLKAVTDPATAAMARPLVIGDARVLRQAMGFHGMPQATLHPFANPVDYVDAPGILNLIDIPNADPAAFAIGRVSGLCGQAAFQYIQRAVSLAMAGQAAAVATPPINKESLREGGVDFIGHTEIFASLTSTPDPLTLFEVRSLRVFFLSRHVSLRRACELVTKERIKQYAIRCLAALHKLGVAQGAMAVAGLNPHCGEHGLFGDEEVREVAPAIEELRRQGYPVVGPIGADSVFAQALAGKYNSVLSLYHDQGHIATKTLDFERTISITAGMPILRTSVDHGTAFDIAGHGVASAVSMQEAIRLAVKYAGAYGR